MIRKQWYSLGIGLFIFGLMMMSLRGPICLGDDSVLTACIIRRYSYVIPGLISIALGVIFSFVGRYSKK